MVSVEDLRKLWTRLRLLAGRYRVVAAEESGGVVELTLEGFLGELRTGVRHLEPFGLAVQAAAIPADSECLGIAELADRGNLVAIGVQDRTTRPVLAAGDVALYNATRVFLRFVDVNDEVGLTAASVDVAADAGNVEISATDTVAILSEDVVALASGNVTVIATGTVAITGATVTINGVNFSTHTHTIPAGTDAAGGVSGVPA